jgi:NAD(P)H dehydrogenase (quinone)
MVEESNMYAVTGITGQVGGAVATSLLTAGQPVRAVVRSLDKGKVWADRGCDLAVATVTDAEALTAAFSDSDGVFLMMPPNFDPAPGFPEIQRALASILSALKAARPAKIVLLSTVGAHVEEPTLLTNAKMTEDALGSLPMPVAFLRAGWFMENAAWDVAAAKAGAIRTFLQPTDHLIPMVATADIGRVAAELLREAWTNQRVVELEGPRRYSARDIASGFSHVLGHPVKLDPVPRDSWEALFRSQGAQYPMPRIRMLDGFNEGWIDFEGGAADHRKGQIPLESVLRDLVTRSATSDQ